MNSNLSTYLTAKHKKDLKIYGNPFSKGGFFKNLCTLIKIKKFHFIDFQKNVFLEDPNQIDESNTKVVNFLKNRI